MLWNGELLDAPLRPPLQGPSPVPGIGAELPRIPDLPEPESGPVSRTPDVPPLFLCSH